MSGVIDHSRIAQCAEQRIVGAVRIADGHDALYAGPSVLLGSSNSRQRQGNAKPCREHTAEAACRLLMVG
jgi:hypothetical protein